ncbi:phosphatidylethanolamine-binding protein [Diplocarpon mali]|nr:phosphatidylethanolamine-binding protein [Diplocarpon mali]
MSLGTYSEDVVASLTAANIAPGSTALIPQDFKPSIRLNLKYGDKDVSLSTVLRTSETKTAPRFSFDDGRSGGSYTLLLVDPDAPTPEEPRFAYWRHWIVTGLSGASGEDVPTLTEYLGPGPKDESASRHRYLFLLLREPEGFAVTRADVGGETFVERRSFEAAQWVEKHGLVLVGANWFSGVGDS